MTRFSVNHWSAAQPDNRLAERIMAGYERWRPAFIEHFIAGTELERCNQWLTQMRKNQHDALIVIGMGGSSLGAKAISGLVGNEQKGELLFLEGSHPQLQTAARRLIQEKKPAILWVSKSGTTLESRTNLSALRDLDANLPEYYITSQPDKITDLGATEENTFHIPEPLGGRFSIVSPVGILPGLFMGADMSAFMQGFQNGLRRWGIDVPLKENGAMQVASQYHALLSKKEYVGVVFWVYSRELFVWGDWLLQLWGESIGKNEAVTALPFLARGPEDQHSLLQYFLDGPNNMLHTFVQAAAALADLEVGERVAGDFTGKKLTSILAAQKQSIVLALDENQRPVSQFLLDEADSLAALGEWMCFWMFVISYLGYCYEVNPFDQPAVEQGKVYCKKLLGGAVLEDPLGESLAL